MSVFKRKVKDGEHLVVDDRTGFTVWSGETTREELTGHMTRRRSADQRNPQEVMRPPRAERQSVDDPRPPGIDNYVGPLITKTSAAGDAGDQTITVETNARFRSGDRIRIVLNSGDVQSNIVTSISGIETVNFAFPLKEGVESGALVTNVSALSKVTY